MLQMTLVVQHSILQIRIGLAMNTRKKAVKTGCKAKSMERGEPVEGMRYPYRG